MRFYGPETFINWYKRNAARMMFQNRVAINPSAPYISFSFDDFPQSALHVGGAILKSYGLAGTYYTSFGLVDSDSPSGRVCSLDDLETALEQGHELGCHTYSHCHSWETKGWDFEQSIIKNQAVLAETFPGASFRSFAYPISLPRPGIKRVCAKHFSCCRAGGQKLNAGMADLNQLSAFFLEKAKGNIRVVKDLINENKELRAWLILATHDVSPDPSPYGCSPNFFDEVVRYSIESGARILPVVEAMQSVQLANS